MHVETLQFLSSLTGEEQEKRIKYAQNILPTLVSVHHQEDYSTERILDKAFGYADDFIQKCRDERERVNWAQVQKQLGTEELYSWVMKNGSEKLKQEINIHGKSPQTLIGAEHEFLNAHCPEGFSSNDYLEYDEGTFKDSGSEAEKKAKQEMKALEKDNPHIYRKIQHVWASYRDERGEITAYQALLQMEIITPNYTTFTVAKPFPETRREMIRPTKN